MHTITRLTVERDAAGVATYTVHLSDGRRVAELRRAALASYPAFELAAALQGVRVVLVAGSFGGRLDGLPRAVQQCHWLNLLAEAAAAGVPPVQAGAGRPRRGRGGPRAK